MKKMIVVGLGHVWNEHYAKTIAKLQQEALVELVGAVDPNPKNTDALPSGIWSVGNTADIPPEFINSNIVPMILTPDHYQVIEDLVKMGFQNILCEKPLVSRVSEIDQVRGLIENHGVKLYAIDFYLPKTLGLQMVRGFLKPKDPRYEWLAVSDPDADFPAILGEIEGVGVQVVEAGSFCIKDIAGRPYLATDKEIGGMILDLVTHACGPLHQAGLLLGCEVLDVSLSRLRSILDGPLVPVSDSSREVEMYATALLEAGGMPIHLAFGKVPIDRGGLWALEVRGKNGMYYAGLRTGQPSILVGNDGKVVTFSLKIAPYEFVVREALLHFEGELPGFDGNFGAFSASMAVGRKMLEKYRELRPSQA